MNDDPSIDEILMNRIAGDDRASLEKLIRLYAVRLMNLIKRMMGDHHHSEEIFQEVVLTLWQKRESYQFPRPVQSWLFQIAVNHCRQQLRKKPPPKTNQDVMVSLIKHDEFPESRSLRHESAESIKQSVEQLPQQQRMVVILRIWNEMSYREISEVMDVEEATVRSYMHHALKSLRERLKC